MTIEPITTFWVSFLTIAPVFFLIAARRVFQPGPLSPVWITVAVISIVGTSGFLLSDFLTGAQGGSIVLELSPSQRIQTALLYAATAWLIIAGSFGSVFVRARTSIRADLRALSLNHRTQTLALLVAIVPLVLMGIALGDTILARSVYLAGERGGQLLGLGQQLATAAAAIIGYVIVAGSKTQRFFAIVIGVAILAVFFGLGSRRLALLPIVVAIGAVLANPKKWVRYLLPAALVAAVLLPLPLYLRGSMTHGILPYLGQLASFDIALIDWRSTINNVLISFPITGATVFQVQPIPMEYFWVSLNPLPGNIAGFYDITENLGLNRYTPYSTIGEVWNRGPMVGLLFWLSVGVLLAWLDGQVGKWMRTRYAFVGLIIVVLAALFALTCLQYNLRASGRMLIYAAAATMAASIILSPVWSRRNRSAIDPPHARNPTSQTS